MSDEPPVVHLDLPAASEAPRQARGALDDLTGGLRIADRADFRVLVSESIAAVGHDGRFPVVLDVWRLPQGFRVQARGPEHVVDLDPLAEILLDKIAAAWHAEPGLVSFDLAASPPLPGASTEDDLFARADAGDVAARDALVERYQGFARALARRFEKPHVKGDDVDQVALLALVKALARFDLARGVKFTTFAARTIEGELKRHLRDSGWSIRVPRRLQETGLEASRVAADLAQREGREPTLEELAGSLGADRSDVIDALVARRSFGAASLDAPVGEDQSLRLVEALPDRDRDLALAPQWAELAMVIERLPARERRILYLRFYEDLSQSEIADRVGISQMHVSRLLAKSLSELRQMIEPTEGG
jgi:RNA polymerase sigma-B factor